MASNVPALSNLGKGLALTKAFLAGDLISKVNECPQASERSVMAGFFLYYRCNEAGARSKVPKRHRGRMSNISASWSWQDLGPSLERGMAQPKRAPMMTGAAGPVFEDFLPYLIAQLAHKLNNDLIDKLRPHGINIARWRILAALAMGEGIAITEIMERAMLQQSALSRMLMKMESEGYVRRRPRPENTRVVEVYMTPKGHELFNNLDAVVRRRQNRLLDGFSKKEIGEAFVLIRRLLQNMEN